MMLIRSTITSTADFDVVPSLLLELGGHRCRPDVAGADLEPLVELGPAFGLRPDDKRPIHANDDERDDDECADNDQG